MPIYIVGKNKKPKSKGAKMGNVKTLSNGDARKLNRAIRAFKTLEEAKVEFEEAKNAILEFGAGKIATEVGTATISEVTRNQFDSNGINSIRDRLTNAERARFEMIVNYVPKIDSKLALAEIGSGSPLGERFKETHTKEIGSRVVIKPS